MENLLYICQHNNLSFMKYIVYIFSLVWLTCLFASCSSKHAHFISDSTYRARVEQDFQQKQVVMSKGNLFAIFDTDLTLYEREALEFLYAYMPLADITDYSGGFHLMNVQAAHRASEEMPWGRMVSEELFRHFVLPVRVNNEPLDSARVVFYEELKPRVQHLSMRNAILEVNHWCHEKAVYQPSDARTSSPHSPHRLRTLRRGVYLPGGCPALSGHSRAPGLYSPLGTYRRQSCLGGSLG